jgi:hypothetical protein
MNDERTGGSITGRKRLTQSRTSGGTVLIKAEKEQAQMTIRPVTEDDDDQEAEATDSDTPSLKPSDITGYQVPSASITLDEIVWTKKSAPASLLSPINPTSSRATLLPAYAKVDRNPNPLTLSFPCFKSAPLAFAFLTNGARAWKAFVRSYPLAIVGLPIGWEWDVNRAVFELKVRVGSHDRAGLGEDTQDGSGPFIDQEEATEIFVPLLHFAKDDVVKRAFGVPVAPSSSRRRQIVSDGPPTPGTVPLPAAFPLPNDASTISLSMDSTKGGSDPTIGISTARGSRETSLEREEEAGMGMEDALDLEVLVNAGRWTVEGQVLKWWYPIPAATPSQAPSQTSNLNLPSSNAKLPRSQSTMSVPQQRPSKRSNPAPPKRNPDGTVEYTITIQRRSGAIDFKKLGVPENWVGMGPRTDARSKSRQGRKGGNKSDCCGNGCVIA